MICEVLFKAEHAAKAAEESGPSTPTSGGSKKSTGGGHIVKSKASVKAQCELQPLRWRKLKYRDVNKAIWGQSGLSDDWCLELLTQTGRYWASKSKSGTMPSTPKSSGSGSMISFELNLAGTQVRAHISTDMLASLALERSFALIKSKKSSSKKSSSSKDAEKKKKGKKKRAAKVSYVKCRMQVEVGMRKWLKDGPELRKALLHLDDAVMTLPLVKKFLALNRGKQNDPALGGEAKFPDVAMMNKLANADEDDLANADKFFKLVFRDIPRPYERLLCFETILDLPALITEAKEKANKLEKAANTVIGSHRFKVLLELILGSGNYLNSSHEKLKGCWGFDILSTFQKLPLFKTSDGSSNLLVWVLTFYRAIVPDDDLSKLEEEWSSIQGVETIVPRALNKLVKDARNRLMQLDAELGLPHEDKEDQFNRVGKAAIDGVTEKLDALEERVTKVTKTFKTLVLMLGQDPSDVSDPKSYSAFWEQVLGIPSMLCSAKSDMDEAKRKKEKSASRRTSTHAERPSSNIGNDKDQSTFDRMKQRLNARKRGSKRRGFRLPGL